jgi:cation diffusion facilitator CzcD-associated flavoprotein CzcO
LDVYQRTAPWVLPRTDRPTTRLERVLYRTLPFTQRLSRKAIYWSREILVAGMRGNRLVRGALQVLGTAQLRRQVQDPQLRAKLTPKFDIGCKRILLSNTWYPALTKPNVELITDSITEIRPTGVLTADGVLHEVDAIVYGTGFHVTDPPTANAIFNSKGESLAEHWQGSPKCYLGTAIDGYPNLFMLVGPNSGVGHTSILLSIEWQVHYATQAIAAATEYGISSYSLRPDVMAEWIDDVDRLSEGTVWLDGGCSSYYIDASGRNSSTWPTYTWKLRDRLADFDPESYAVRREVAAPAPASA